jgi:hypothetical protein
LKYGDRNTHYFHASAKQMRQKNQLDKIQNEEGRLWETHEGIGNAFIDYYSRLFTIEGSHDLHRCLRAVVSHVLKKTHNLLLVEFTGEEVHIAVNQMAYLKDPGPDGFTTSFFQQNWATVGTEV